MVWVAIGVPIEVLKGFDVVVVVPENHAAVCGARKAGAAQAAKAEARGYSPDLCSYARIDLGTVFDHGNGSPTMGLPRPNLIISDTNNCSLLVKWFDVHHRMLDVPHVVLDVPFCYAPQKKEDLDYILAQYHDLIRLMEKLTGQTYDPDRVREAVRNSDEGVRHWKRFLSFAAHRPSGITAFDTFIHMAPVITSLRGSPDLTDHFRQLADEVEQRVNEGVFPVPNEKYRLLWDNIAPWHQLRPMSNRLAEMKANIVYATYTSCIGTLEGQIDRYPLQADDPLVDLARIQNQTVCPYGLELRFQAMSRIIQRFGIDGIVFSSNKSCKVYSLMQLDLQKRIGETFGLPSVMVELDMADERHYNEANTFTRFDALIERIEAGMD